MNQIGIIGFGRFGKVLARILQKGFNVIAYDPNFHDQYECVKTTTLDLLLEAKTIFVCVPISQLESVIKKISPNLSVDTTIIDVCSVKLYPKKVMEKYLPKNIGYIATHPLFGPDSFNLNKNLKMTMYAEKDIYKVYNFWKEFFSGQGIEIINMNPKIHDKLAANSQGLTHFIGRTLMNFGAKRTNIDTEGYRNLLNLMEQTCNDTQQLYNDLQKYNPYTKKMINSINQAVNSQMQSLEEINGK